MTPIRVVLLAALTLGGCSGGGGDGRGGAAASGAPTAAGSTGPQAVIASAPPMPSRSPAGNPTGGAGVPAAARPVDTSRPDHVIGTGTPASCTSGAFVAAVADGGIITFNCGPAPVTIALTATAKVRNDHKSRVVIDGGGKVTLSGGGKRRILYLNTCDPAQVWTTSHCQDQSTPTLTVQNVTFSGGNSTGETMEGGGGGAIFDRGGLLKVINSRFVDNRCDSTGPDLGGAAIRVLSMYRNQPAYVVNSTFTGGVCSNGAALSSIGVSWVVLNSVFTGNKAIGNGANPAKSGTPGGGSGGAIYLDGNTFTLTLDGCKITGNNANEGGGAVFFVSNDRTGTMTVRNSTLTDNRSGQFQNFPGIFFLGAHNPTFTRSTVK